ncbi:glycosyltransferase [Jinshanibacter sp. LJY008]|uniref:Glycosyltransferase n=1 Tax=Limnobaculum eriocheiris TaxID=2897391 RepID=A0A9X1MSL8_9GAMM|nr:glycosyltransferase [Limnobaculum eriocheiris]MCD1124781.1 glycosyltransferase [Limnobaculum eriocheiris]
MKIMYFITGLGVGGAERQVCNLADGMSKLGHSVTIISLNGNVILKPNDKKINIISLNIKKNPWGIFIALLKAREVINKIIPDVVHSHMYHANIFVRMLRIITPIRKLINTSHSNNEGGKMRMFLYRVTKCIPDLSTNVSNSAVNSLLNHNAVDNDKIITVYNGISSCEFSFSESERNLKRKELGVDERTKLILSVGRFTQAKDYPNLLYAIKCVFQKIPDIKVVIIGDGELKPDIQKLAEELGLTNLIYFLGVRNDIPGWMSAADLFVLSSAWEGFGMVVAEAMLCERLIVATDSGGVKEVLGEQGFLVEPGNSEKLACAMVHALELPAEESLILMKKARMHSHENFDLNKIIERWLSIY